MREKDVKYSYTGDMELHLGGAGLVIKKGRITRGGTEKTMLSFLGGLCLDWQGVRADDMFKLDAERLAEQHIDQRILYVRAAEEIVSEKDYEIFSNIFPTVWDGDGIWDGDGSGDGAKRPDHSRMSGYTPQCEVSREYRKRLNEEMEKTVKFPRLSEMYGECRLEVLRIIAARVARCRTLTEYAKILRENRKVLYGTYIRRHAGEFRAAEKRAVRLINYGTAQTEKAELMRVRA